MSSNENIVKLNIGGTIFKTSKTTLTKYNGMLKTMLETGIPVAKDESGSIFIDRDPTFFRSILNFMRDGFIILPKSEEECLQIQQEAQYYLLDGLMELCNAELKKRADAEEKKPFEVDEDFKVIKDDAELFKITQTNTNKPILILYYFNNISGLATPPKGVYWRQFLDKYNPKFHIFFKSMKTPRVQQVLDSTLWKWSFHYEGGYSYHTAETELIDNRTVKVSEKVPFLTQMEKSINKFLADNNIFSLSAMMVYVV